jgi:hypothetical protein
VVPVIYDSVTITTLDKHTYGIAVKDKKYGIVSYQSTGEIPLLYDSAVCYLKGDTNFFTAKKGKYWALLNSNMQPLTPFEYDDIVFQKNRNWIGVIKNGKKGIVDFSGHVMVKPLYLNVTILDSFVISYGYPYGKDKEWKSEWLNKYRQLQTLMNLKGDTLIDSCSCSLSNEKDNKIDALFLNKALDSVGFYYATPHKVMMIMVPRNSSFEEAYQARRRFFYPLLHARHKDSILNFGSDAELGYGYYATANLGEYFICDSDGRILKFEPDIKLLIRPALDQWTKTHKPDKKNWNGRFIIGGLNRERDAIYGMADTSGKVLIYPQYAEISTYKKDTILAWEKWNRKKVAVYDKDLHLITPMTRTRKISWLNPKEVDTNRIRIRNFLGKQYLYDRKRHKRVSGRYHYIWRVEGLPQFQVSDHHRQGIISAKGDTIIPIRYFWAYGTHPNLHMVYMVYDIDKNGTGLIDSKGNILLPCTPCEIEDKRNGYFVIHKDKPFIIDWKGDKFFEDQ